MKRKGIGGWGQRYCLGFLGSVVLLAAAVIGVNVAVDPLGVLGLWSVEGLTTPKVRRDGSRVEKSLRLWMDSFDTVFLGTSRVEVGLDPKSPALGGVDAYNAALSGSNMAEIEQVGRFLLEHNRPKMIIMGLDFHMFTKRQGDFDDLAQSGFAGLPMLVVLGTSLASVTTLEDSVITIIDNLDGKAPSVRDDGMRANVRFLVAGYDFGAQFPSRLARMYILNTRTYACFEYDRSLMERLRDFMVDARREGVDVRIFLSPEHVWQLEALRSLGLLPQFERWRTELVALVDAVNRAMPAQPPVVLWDFGGYTAITTEDVPEPGAGTRMRGYIDASHYSSAIGDMVLARLLDRDPDDGPASFGAPLTELNVAAANAALTTGHLAYAKFRPDEVAIVDNLVVGTNERRARLCRAIAAGAKVN